MIFHSHMRHIMAFPLKVDLEPEAEQISAQEKLATSLFPNICLVALLVFYSCHKPH